METHDLRLNDVKKEIINGTEIYNYKGIEMDKTTWESAAAPMYCGEITDDEMRQLVVYLYDEMVSVYGKQDVEKYVKIKKSLTNCENCDYDDNDIEYYDRMDQFRWIKEEELFNYFGAEYYEDIDEDDEN